MSDLIRRSDAIDAIMETCCYCSETKILTEIRNLPTIEPKRGEWIEDGGIEKCNQCGERKEFPHWNFCPNCGADMREREGE